MTQRNGLQEQTTPVSEVQLEMIIGSLNNIAFSSEIDQLLEIFKAASNCDSNYLHSSIADVFQSTPTMTQPMTMTTAMMSDDRISSSPSPSPYAFSSQNALQQHVWSSFQHVRPMYCNICREALSCVTRTSVLLNGLSCEVCRCKVHKRCLPSASAIACKWTTLASVVDGITHHDYVSDDDDDDNNREIVMPHQWVEGNLPVNAKCSVCEKTCGSIRRLVDWRCLWCQATVHTGCREVFGSICQLGQNRVSILPPIAITSLDSEGFWQASKPSGTSPLLVFLNSKSGDNQGLKMLRKFKHLLNPAQVFDLMDRGPQCGLRLFQNFESFRVLVCGGDGSIGWVLNEIDRLGLHAQCQIGVLPLGTGNDLARVLGWGTAFDDDSQLPSVLEQLEHAQIKMLDRWSIFAYETSVFGHKMTSQGDHPIIATYKDSVSNHLSRILNSDSYNVVISSAAVLCSTIKEFVAKAATSGDDESDDPMATKCSNLIQKLDALLEALKQEAPKEPELIEVVDRAAVETGMGSSGSSLGRSSNSRSSSEFRRKRNPKQKSSCLRREHLMSRANSIKRAVMQIIEHADKAIDEQNLQTLKYREESTRSDDGGEEEGRRRMRRSGVAQQPSSTAIAEDTHRPDCSFLQYPNIPIITTDMVLDSDEDDDADDEDDEQLSSSSHYLKVLPDRTPTASLSVPSFRCYSSDGDSSTCSTPGQVTPVRSLSPAFDRTGSSCASPYGFSSIRDEKSGGGTRRISNLSALSQTTRFPSPMSFARDKSPSRDSKLMGFPILNIPLLNSLPRCQQSTVSDAAAGRSVVGGGGCPGIGGFIGQVLLENADALCAAASPLFDPEDFALDGYEEKCVMNNYFGIGLDAKIALDFHNRREEHPEKCRSRTKNRMWYGMLGGKEIVQRTFRNLEQRVQLECDGQRIRLPNLQGIVILNIKSYMGGVNFWGGTKVNDSFSAPSFDDNVLEVVAVFGSVQLGISRVINLHRHRIAQCRSVKIAIIGDEGVPVQVDGEAWIQPPGFICIVHKNRAQMLTRDKVFEEALKSWTEKQKIDRPRSPRHFLLNDEETIQLDSFISAADILIKRVKVLALSNSSVEEHLLHLATQALSFLDRISIEGELRKPTHRNQVSDFVSSVRSLYNDVRVMLVDDSSTSLKKDAKSEMEAALVPIEAEMKNVHKIGGLPNFQSLEEQTFASRHRMIKEKHIKRWNFMRRPKRGLRKEAHSEKHDANVSIWTIADVCQWLVTIDLGEYRENFIAHDIRGTELTALGRTDLKELGITKVGHLKRIQQAIKELKT